MFNNVRPLNAAANKKFKRQKFVVNTINHDDDYQGSNNLRIQEPPSKVRRANSNLNRPYTAKSKKSNVQISKLYKKNQ